ncbi:MAG: tRNA (adenosine(37)-N6)-dimethylallyltransferase MiaA [Propionibacteriaceae bacterium]|jgi:tRNA dimethylallyltransferase|nr:tRNA (adenosine(37)-N6)-dimethylallyltransferase MiaA [Propionibacteriaceae bacterium]
MSAVKLLAINGPTASGKSDLALRLARELADRRPVEIVNADSMLVYRGMDIGTAKPSRAQRAAVPHHLVDIMDVTEEASVALFQRLARQAVAEVGGRGALPVLVGGSALYMRAVLDAFEFPATDPAVRARWEEALRERGPQALHSELARLAPEAAAAIEPGNGRRIVRALEVVELTGSFTAVIPEPEYALEGVEQIGLTLERGVLDARIEQRVREMWRAGFVDEVAGLLERGLRRGRTASRALGYRQIIRFLDGEIGEDEAFEATVVGTRRFARKQLAWFKRDPRIVWFDALEGTDQAVSHVRARLA